MRRLALFLILVAASGCAGPSYPQDYLLKQGDLSSSYRLGYPPGDAPDWADGNPGKIDLGTLWTHFGDQAIEGWVAGWISDEERKFVAAYAIRFEAASEAERGAQRMLGACDKDGEPSSMALAGDTLIMVSGNEDQVSLAMNKILARVGGNLVC